MSSPELDREELRRVRRRVVDLYDAITILMLIGIAVLIYYAAVLVGPLSSPGAQQSFGYAVALMFIMSALIVHLIDRAYRVWPLGRRISPPAPGPVTAAAQARFVKVLIVVIAGAAIAYLLAGLFT
ncbi:MAG TPA: hypothetical protein VMG14_05545 [Thermoplasmata archaeon]|nr:hypothetical protein [Thermoplasmata archaeon]